MVQNKDKQQRVCRDCGAPLAGRALRCPRCKAAHEKELRQKWRADHKVTVTCERCGEVFVTEARNTRKKPTLCAACWPLVPGEQRAERRKAQRARRGPRRVAKLPAAAAPTDRPARPEPQGSPDSLGHVMWELDTENRRRRRKGLAPLSYGRYIAQREHRAKF